MGAIKLSMALINSATKRSVPHETPQGVEFVAPQMIPVFGEVSEKSLKGDARSQQARSVPQFCLQFLILTDITASMPLSL